MRAAALAAAFLAVACSKGSEPQICAGGDTRCEGNAFEVCSDDGERWEVRTDCAARGDLCVVGMGCVDCFPDTRACVDQDIVRCRPDGSGAEGVTSVANGWSCISRAAAARSAGSKAFGR